MYFSFITSDCYSLHRLSMDNLQNQIAAVFHGSKWSVLKVYLRIKLILPQKLHFINVDSKGHIDN